MDSTLDRFYSALKELSTADLETCVTADFVLNWQGNNQIPWAGTWHGVAGLLEFVALLNQHIEIVQIDRLHQLQDASVAIVVLRGQWRAKATRQPVSAIACNVFSLVGDKIQSYTVMNNTAAFVDALSASTSTS